MRRSHNKGPYKNMAEWVLRDGNEYAQELAEDVAARLTMAELMTAHSEATIMLCGPISDHLRERWKEALAAVCKEIGNRFDALARQANERLPSQIRHMWTAQTDMWTAQTDGEQ